MKPTLDFIPCGIELAAAQRSVNQNSIVCEHMVHLGRLDLTRLDSSAPPSTRRHRFTVLVVVMIQCGQASLTLEAIEKGNSYAREQYW